MAYVTLRLLKPMCSITSAWCEENLLTSTKRVLSNLHTLTVPPSGSRTASSHSVTELLSAPAFAFCFSFLKCVLKDGGKAVGGDEDLRYQALQVMAEHCSLRASDDQEQDDEEDKEVSKRLHTLNCHLNAQVVVLLHEPSC